MSKQKLISMVQAFNDCINKQDIEGLSALMTENHCFIDRDGEPYDPVIWTGAIEDDLIFEWRVYADTP